MGASWLLTLGVSCCGNRMQRAATRSTLKLPLERPAASPPSRRTSPTSGVAFSPALLSIDPHMSVLCLFYSAAFATPIQDSSPGAQQSCTMTPILSSHSQSCTDGLEPIS